MKLGTILLLTAGGGLVAYGVSRAGVKGGEGGPTGVDALGQPIQQPTTLQRILGLFKGGGAGGGGGGGIRIPSDFFSNIQRAISPMPTGRAASPTPTPAGYVAPIYRMVTPIRSSPLSLGAIIPQVSRVSVADVLRPSGGGDRGYGGTPGPGVSAGGYQTSGPSPGTPTSGISVTAGDLVAGIIDIGAMVAGSVFGGPVGLGLSAANVASRTTKQGSLGQAIAGLLGLRGPSAAPGETYSAEQRTEAYATQRAMERESWTGVTPGETDIAESVAAFEAQRAAERASWSPSPEATIGPEASPEFSPEPGLTPGPDLGSPASDFGPSPDAPSYDPSASLGVDVGPAPSPEAPTGGFEFGGAPSPGFDTPSGGYEGSYGGGLSEVGGGGDAGAGAGTDSGAGESGGMGGDAGSGGGD